MINLTIYVFNMRRLLTLLFFFSFLCGAVYAQQMTDDQVVQYVKDAQKTGKSQQEITTELMRRGVTKEQVERIRMKYESEQQQTQRQEVNVTGGGAAGDNVIRERTQTQERMQAQDREQLAELEEVNRNLNFQSTSDSDKWEIFGHDIFTNNLLTFEPNVNTATPANYQLGPGDEVIIDVWGASETTIRQVITPEGCIRVTTLGPVYLSGKTVREANEYLKQEFSKIYSGVSGDAPTTHVNLTLGQIRTIQVNVMGEVVTPGTYTLSAFASVFHALYRAGGVNSIGSMRSIRVVRAENVIADLDV